MDDLNEIKTKLSKRLYSDYKDFYDRNKALNGIVETLEDLLDSSQFPPEDIYEMIVDLRKRRPEYFMKHLIPKIVKSKLINQVKMDE